LKVKEVSADGTNVLITLEPENPAEIAILRLMNGCGAKCSDLAPNNLDQANANSRIEVTVKSGYQ
jgi:hypothetical protein